MNTQRLPAADRRDQIIGVMNHLHQTAKTQAEFTAARVANACGISTVLLYRYASNEFRALRAKLPGPRRPREEVLRKLRRENAELRRQLLEAKKKARATGLSEIDEALRMIEGLEEENLHLREKVKRLSKQLEDSSRVVVHVPATRDSGSAITAPNQQK